MLNFCPDLLSEPPELHRATRELLFLIDRSGSMSGINIHRIKVMMEKTHSEEEGIKIQVKSEVYIHRSQIHLIKLRFSQFLTFNPSKNAPSQVS
jgi:hypothetical protein